MDSSAIGSFIKTRRKALGMTQLDIAKELLISPQAISKWERSESLPDIALLPELAELLGVSVADIIEASEKGIKEQGLPPFVDDALFEALCRIVKRHTLCSHMAFPYHSFAYLEAAQKDTLLALLMEKSDYRIVIDELIPYLGNRHRCLVVSHILDCRDYSLLEKMLPFMPKSAKIAALHHLLEQNELDAVGNMLPYLNREHKAFLITFVFEHQLELNILDDYMVFFDRKQQKVIADYISNAQK